MPRGNRYIVGAPSCHITHRCHNREFLLKFAKDRDQYRRRLCDALSASRVALLDYTITSNHVHLLVNAEDQSRIPVLMQQAAGEFARDYNRRKNRSGAFWESRYHATQVDSGSYLWRCLLYIELNMVRCGKVHHPEEWDWCGFSELTGSKQRNRLLNLQTLLELLGLDSREELKARLQDGMAERVRKDQLKRESLWTESIAVGSESFIDTMATKVRHRHRLVRDAYEGCCLIREEHAPLFGTKNSSIAPNSTHELDLSDWQ